METTETKTANRQTNSLEVSNFEGSEENRSVQKRLDTLLALNAEYDRREEIFRSDTEMFEADLMKNPLSIEKTFAYFGLLLGTFPPAAFFTKFFLESGGQNEGLWIFCLLFFVNLVTALTGYLSGKLIGKITFELEKLSWHPMLLALPFIGLLWGIIAGGAGGFFIFVFGAIFGAMLGGIVGSVALPMFTVFHRLFKRGDKIERKHFLPIAFGTSLIISAFILGM